MICTNSHARFIICGFITLLTLLSLISYIGTSQINQVNSEFERVINQHNQQAVFATQMRDAARERMMELWRISLTNDPFNRNDSYEDFLGHATTFLEAREEFINTNLSPEEIKLYELLLKATTISSTYHRKIAEQFMREEPVSNHEMLARTLPSQKHSLDALNRIIDLQAKDNEYAFKQASKKVHDTVELMVYLTATTVLLGCFIALFNFKHQTKLQTSLHLINLELEKRVKERTHQLMHANAQLQTLAHHDNLTGLANRALLNEQLDIIINQAKRDQKKSAVLFIDLDNFKPINDKYGHDVGDIILKKVASRITNNIRSSDLAARIGGDEFIIVLSDVHEVFHATTFAKMLNATLREPITIKDSQLEVSTSIGISIYPDHARSTEKLITAADQAMYSSKHAGKNQYLLFKPEMSNKHKITVDK